MKTILTRILPLTLVSSFAILPLAAQKANRYWLDTFDISTSTFDINTEIATRQNPNLTGSPVSWVANVVDQATDFHQQTTGAVLQLAGEGALQNVLASPDFDFKGTYGPAPVNVIGKKVSVLLDVLTNNPGGSYYSQASITIGSSTPLAQAGQAGSGFSVICIEDGFGGGGNFIQVRDGDFLVANNIPNPAGFNALILEIFIDDPADGNPWDGVGSSVLIVKGNGTEIVRYEKTGGGYTSNYISLEGFMQSVGAQLGLHTFDGLTVFRFPDNESTLGLTAFETWALANGLGVYPNIGNDSDLDGKTDGEEFAIDGDPLNPANDGKILGEPVLVGSDEKLTLTFPVRAGADFAGTTSAQVDGVLYFLQATTDLSTTTGVFEVVPAFETGMPALNPGYEYRTFTTLDPLATLGKTFMQLNTGPVIP